MSDLIHRFTQWLDYNRWTAIALLLMAGVSIGLFQVAGCASKTTLAGQTVTRPQLEQVVQAEEVKLIQEREQLTASIAVWDQKVKALNASVNTAIADLDDKDLQKQKVLEVVNTVATGAANGTLNIGTAIPAGIGLLGIALGLGAGLDNRRKDGVIADLKDKTVTPGT